MSEEKNQININMVQLLNLSCNLLQQGFVKQPKQKAKQLLKDLKAGKRMPLGKLTLQEKHEMPLRLELDYSEFRGPFNFPSFEAALRGMLQRCGQTMEAKKDLNILTNEEQGSALVHLPGVIEQDGRFNVLVTCFEMGNNKEITIRLMFLDPDQYPQFRSKDEATEVEPDSE